jgi:cytochrome c
LIRRALLLLGLGLGAAGAAHAADAANGAVQFRRCAVCHSLQPGKASGLGPNLRGVVGRKAGTLPFAYSPAMKQSGIVWTEPRLDAYLAAPARAIPGNRMAFPGLPSAKDRADIIEYLRKAK